MSISKDKNILSALQDWECLAPPKRADQWKDGRSAKEAARAWLEGGGVHLPPEVASALAKHPSFGPVLKWDAEPEVKLRFDKFAGEPRNSDLVVYAQDMHGSFLIAVEAKADEPYGETVAGTLAAALERHLKNDRSNGIERVKQLAQALFGPQKPQDPPIKEIRYQLLTACAGALCEAERCNYSRALMLVHEFVTDKTKDENHCRNAADLNMFLKRLSHCEAPIIADGDILGPFNVPGAPLIGNGVQLFVGKVSRNLRVNCS